MQPIGFCYYRPREAAAELYNESLKEKFRNFPEIRRIARHRHVPKYILNNKAEHRLVYFILFFCTCRVEIIRCLIGRNALFYYPVID